MTLQSLVILNWYARFIGEVSNTFKGFYGSDDVRIIRFAQQAQTVILSREYPFDIIGCTSFLIMVTVLVYYLYV